MTDRAYDIVIFGASGFTGSRVLRYACKACPSGIHLAIAGRTKAKLQEVRKEYGADGTIEIIDAVDVNDRESLLRMASSCRLLLNCVGPYRHYGEAVVQACVDARTDYMDICGEPEFMEKMQLQYSKAAQDARIFATSAVGFDCVPAEIGAAFCVETISVAGRVPHHVDSYLRLKWGSEGASGQRARGIYAHDVGSHDDVRISNSRVVQPNSESAVYGLSSTAGLKKVREELKAQGKNRPPTIPGPKPKRAPAYVWSHKQNAYVLPFPGADASVVRRTMSSRGRLGRPVSHYSASFTIDSSARLVAFLVIGATLMNLVKASFARETLLAYPGIFTLGAFSRSGPSQAQMDGTSFTMVHEGFAVGQRNAGEPVPPVSKTPDVVVRVHGPEPGYVATPIFLVEAALELLAHRASIVEALQVPGAVCTPGELLLLHGSTYVDRLRSAGISVTVDPGAAAAVSAPAS